METFISINTYAAIGLTVVAALIGLGWFLTFIAGKLLWRRLVRVYHFTVILYWLDRLEKGGRREFQKAEAEDKAKAAQGDTL